MVVNSHCKEGWRGIGGGGWWGREGGVDDLGVHCAVLLLPKVGDGESASYQWSTLQGDIIHLKWVMKSWGMKACYIYIPMVDVTRQCIHSLLLSSPPLEAKGNVYMANICCSFFRYPFLG